MKTSIIRATPQADGGWMVSSHVQKISLPAATLADVPSVALSIAGLYAGPIEVRIGWGWAKTAEKLAEKMAKTFGKM